MLEMLHVGRENGGILGEWGCSTCRVDGRFEKLLAVLPFEESGPRGHIGMVAV